LLIRACSASSNLDAPCGPRMALSPGKTTLALAPHTESVRVRPANLTHEISDYKPKIQNPKSKIQNLKDARFQPTQSRYGIANVLREPPEGGDLPSMWQMQQAYLREMPGQHARRLSLL